jgi:hypothetical protein
MAVLALSFEKNDFKSARRSLEENCAGGSDSDKVRDYTAFKE